VDGEIVVERRRQWTPEEKAALMAEVEAEGEGGSRFFREHRDLRTAYQRRES
jgi:hypothetical protein